MELLPFDTDFDTFESLLTYANKGTSQGTAGPSRPTVEELAELERDIKADLARWGCEQVAVLLEPEPGLTPEE